MTKAEHPLAAVPLRAPPQNLEAEQLLLGALLANNRAFDRLPDGFRAEHFADPVHGRIFEAIARRIERNQLASATALKSDLENAGLLEEVGGTRYLAELVNATVGVVNAGEYARVIHHCHLRRELIALGVEVVERAFGDGALDAPAQIDAAEEALYRLGQGGAADRPLVPAGRAAAAAVGTAREAAGTRGLRGTPTGYAALDRLTGGLRRGRMTALGARPGMGKTALALGIAARAARAGERVLFVSLEMDAEELGQRLVSAASGIPVLVLSRGCWIDNDPDTGRFVRREISAAEWARADAARAAVEALPLVIDDRPAQSVAQIRARARHEARRPGGLGLIVVDYAQLLRPRAEDARKTLYEQSSAISADITGVARELGVPLLLLAQLNRQSEGREGHRPTMADLRNSGAFEQDAYAVALLWREEEVLAAEVLRQRPKEDVEEFANRRSAHAQAAAAARGKATLFVDKNRGGPKGTVALLFDGPTSWFRDPDEPEGGAAW